MEREALIAGVSLSELEDCTHGEVLSLIHADQERQRRRAQMQSSVAWHHAMLIGRVVSGGKIPQVWESFPFWTQEETAQLRIQRIAQQLRSMGVREEGERHV